MSNIPLPALNVQQPQAPDMVGNYERILQIRNMLQNAPLQRQAMQQQVQIGQVDLQKAQQSQQDQQTFRAAMMDPSSQGKTIGDIADSLAAKGAISPQSWQGMKKADLEQRQTLATLTKDQLDNAQKAHGMTQELYNNVMNMPDDQLAANWPAIAQQYDQIPGNNKMPLNPQQPLTKDQLKQFGPVISMQAAYLEDAAKKQQTAAETFKSTAQGNEATAQTNKINQETQFGPAGDAAEAKYRSILQKKAAGQPLTADDVSFARGFEASNAKTSTTSDTLGVTSSNSSRPAGLASVGVGGNRAAAPTAVPGGSAPASPGSPQGPSSTTRNSIVDLIGQYRYDPAQLSRLVAKHPDVLALIQQKYPDFDQTTYQAKNKLVQGYTSGPQSREINAYNTTMGHLSVLDDAVSALNNGNVRLLNSLANSVGAGTGNDAQTVFKAIVHRVGPEITGAYISGGGGEGERATNEEDFNLNLGPQQLHTNIATSAKLLDSKVQALENQYKNSVGRDDFAQRFITPEAQAARSKLIGGAGGGKTTRYKIVNGGLTPQ